MFLADNKQRPEHCLCAVRVKQWLIPGQSLGFTGICVRHSQGPGDALRGWLERARNQRGRLLRQGLVRQRRACST